MKDNTDNKEGVKGKIKKPCCAAEALRQVRRIDICSVPTGLYMLDSIFGEVSSSDLRNEQEIKRELLKKVKIYNYVPKAAEEKYADAIFNEFLKEMNKKW
ncbi:hypothetical protein F1737_07960 [Methanoplanus sp. FWC-SCC4]|uniref:Uncharacterized protein n=1 Tax=Methanochimaera problematica TaxID=2609417 RepID=A0AA97I3E9_9EURY|nr:hypothetical protein [Methanoplanus sp. FWC-SCC4]WOF16633.1 hypothetical protein F1737_07960 [Methanoplanus sp. FWC-SCC4]